MAIVTETNDMYRSMFGTDAPPEVINAMRDVSVGQLADKLKQYGPGGGAAGALGGDLQAGVRGIQESLGIPGALENYNKISESIRNLPQDIINRTQGSQEPMTESQRRALEASERDPLSRQLSEASDYYSLLQSLATPRISALETEYATKNQQPTAANQSQYSLENIGGKGYVFNPATGGYQMVGGGGGGAGGAGGGGAGGGLSVSDALNQAKGGQTPQTQQVSQPQTTTRGGLGSQPLTDILHSFPTNIQELKRNIFDLPKSFQTLFGGTPRYNG